MKIKVFVVLAGKNIILYLGKKEMSNACLNLLGPAALYNSESGQKVALAYSKLSILIAYLALEPRAHTRESLADLLWPDLAENDSRANLRRALFNIQHAFAAAGLEKKLIHADRSTISLSIEHFWIDVIEFEKGSGVDSTTLIDQKLGLYRGAFLDGIFPSGDRLADWLQNRRTQYDQKVIFLLERAIALASSAADFEAIEKYSRQLIAIDNLNESAHLQIVKMYIDSGKINAAKKIYDSYCNTLQFQLGVPPPLQLTALFNGAMQPLRAAKQVAKKKIPPFDYRLEYRLVSVLYTHLHPKIPLAQEEWLHLGAAIQPKLHMLVSECNGNFRQLSNSAFVTYFGYPVANEFATQGAVDTGLRLHKLFATEFDYIDIRSAIHTGFIITGSGYTLPDILGESTAIAQDLAETAVSGTLLATEETLHEIATLYDATPVNGASHNAFEVHGAHEYDTETIGAPFHGDRTFVGRIQEIRDLSFAMERADLMGGADVLLIGEAGIGKSRLLRHFLSSAQTKRGDVYWARFRPEYASRPLHPILQLLRSLWVIGNKSLNENELAINFSKTGQNNHNAVQLLAKLLIRDRDGEKMQKLTSSQLEELFFVIVANFKKMRQVFFTTLVLEDIQWGDKLSLDFIAWLRERVCHLGIFLLITSRKHIPALNYASSSSSIIELTALHADEEKALVSQYPQFISAPPQWQHRILEMTDGIPLFIEKVLEHAFENSDKLIDLTCPAPLRNLFMAQIDELGDIGHTLCRASCVGRKFSLQILAKIESISLHRCHQMITKMIASDLIEKSSEPDHFQFRHMLIQDVAFNTLMHSERQQVHLKISEICLQEKTETQISLLHDNQKAPGNP